MKRKSKGAAATVVWTCSSCGKSIKNPIDLKTALPRQNAVDWVTLYFHTVGEYDRVKDKPTWKALRYCPECGPAIVESLPEGN